MKIKKQGLSYKIEDISAEDLKVIFSALRTESDIDEEEAIWQNYWEDVEKRRYGNCLSTKLYDKMKKELERTKFIDFD